MNSPPPGRPIPPRQPAHALGGRRNDTATIATHTRTDLCIVSSKLEASVHLLLRPQKKSIAYREKLILVDNGGGEKKEIRLFGRALSHCRDTVRARGPGGHLGGRAEIPIGSAARFPSAVPK